MRKPSLKNLAETIGVITVLVGLFLVYQELRQARTIARAELSAETNLLLQTLKQQERDPQFASILLKSRQAPRELTATERIQLNSYFHSVLIVYIRERYNYRRGIFESWKEIPLITAPYYFGFGYGKAYWQVRKQNWMPEIVQIVDEALEDKEAIRYYQNFDREIIRNLEDIQAR